MPKLLQTLHLSAVFAAFWGTLLDHNGPKCLTNRIPEFASARSIPKDSPPDMARCRRTRLFWEPTAAIRAECTREAAMDFVQMNRTKRIPKVHGTPEILL